MRKSPASPLLDVLPPSHTCPTRPSCATNLLQFLLTSDGILSIFLLSFSSNYFLLLSLAIVPLSSLTSQTSLRPRYEHQPHLMEQDNDTSLSSGPYRFYQHEDSQYLGMSYAQPHLPYQVIRCHDARFTHSCGCLIAAPALSLRACAVVRSPYLSTHLGLRCIN